MRYHTAEGFVVGGEPGGLRGGAADEGHDTAQQHGEGNGHPYTALATSSSSIALASAPPHLRMFQNLPAAQTVGTEKRRGFKGDVWKREGGRRERPLQACTCSTETKE